MSDLLDQMLGGGGSRQADVDPLEAQLRQEAAARRAAVTPTLGAPDQAGRANVLARATGAPPSIVQANLPSFEAIEVNNRARKLADDHPAYGVWANDPRNAAVGQDDHDAIGKVAGAVMDWSKNPYSIKAPPKAQASIAGFFKGVYESFRLGAVGAHEQLLALVPDFGVSSPASRGYFEQQSQKRIEAAAARNAAATPEFKSSTMSGLYSGASSLATMAPGIAASVVTKSPVPGLAAAGLLAETQAFTKYKARGATTGEAVAGGALEGGLEVATEFLPLGVIVSRYGTTPVKKWIAEYLVKEGLGEQAATLSQDAVDTLIANPNKTWGDYLRERPDAAYQTALATLVAGTVIGGTSEGSRTFIERRERASAAQEGAGHLDKLMGASASSKTRTRDPEAFKALVEGLSPDAKLYVPAEAMHGYMQSEGYSGEFDSFRSAVEDGMATGGDVAVPVSDAASRLAGTPAWEAIRQDVRSSPGGDSLREAEQFNASMADIMAEMTDKMEAQGKAEKVAAAPREALVASMTQKLQDAGFTPHTARQQAELLAQRQDTRAQRLGKDLSADALDGLQVNQVLPEQLAAAQKADNLDLVINAMKRKADVNAAPGVSLLDFISAKGGVQDPGGDLAAMGAKDWHKGKAFKKKLVQDNGRTLDDLAQAAFEAGYFPDATQRPSINDLLDKMGQELGGAPQFANFASEDAARGDTQQAQLVQAADELRALLGEAGIDPATATPREIRAAVAGFGDRAVGAGFDQSAFGDNDNGDGSDILRSFVDFMGSDQALRTGDVVEFGGRIADISGTNEGSITLKFRDDGSSQIVLRKSPDIAVAPYQLWQSFADGPRGRITFPAAGYGSGPSIIDMFQGRDQSTFLHETGHLWLEEMRFDAADPDAPAQLKADWQTVQDWFASNGHPLVDGVIPVDAHELWARGVERYLMEGKAPSPALTKLFETFKSWLVQVYRAVAKLNTPVTDDIRAVMDRLIASDEEIAQAREAQSLEAAFTTKPATMSDDEWVGYQGLVQAGKDDANTAMLAKVMGSIKRRVTKEYNDQKATVRAEVVEEVDRRPEFRALRQLRDSPMDQAALADIYGGDALAMLPKQVPPVYKAGGVSLNDVAELSGFTSSDEMVRTLMGVETARKQLREGGDRRSVREVTIAQETDARTLERYGDPFTDGSIEEEALAAIHNDKQGEVLAAELRVLSRGTRDRPTPYSVAKAWAAKTIREGTVAETTSKSSLARYRRTAAKAGKASVDAILAGDNEEAFRQKQAQMLNNALLAEGARVGDEVDAAVNRLSNWAKRKTIKSVDQDYLERAQALLSAVEMRPRSQSSLDKQAGFEAWAAEQEANGHDVVVPASFAASLGSTHWSRLTVDQFLGLDAAVTQIIHLGRFKQQLLDNKEARDLEDVVREAEAQGDRIGRKPPSTDLVDPSWGDKMKAGALNFDAALLKIEAIVGWLDENRSDGVFNRVVFQPIAEAEANERAMLTDYYARIRAAFETIDKGQLKRWQETADIPELQSEKSSGKIARSKLIMMALNMGNAGNVQRLVDGYGWNEQGVREVLNRELSEQDWQFVQQIWDIVDTLWPQISQLERRVNGVEPDKVEAIPVETPHGTLRGGYFPAIYDSTKDDRAASNQGKESDLMESNYTRATTRASATKDRAAKVKRPILLNLGVINRHVGEVIHDITHREAIINANKFLSQPRVKSMIRETLSPEIEKQFRPWLKFVANQWAMERAGNEGLGAFMQKLRSNTTVVGMGFRISTVLTQIAGYSNSFEYVGAGHVSAAIAATAKNPIATLNFVMDRSAEVKNRLDTLDRDINATMRQMAGSNRASDALTAAKRFAFHGIGYADRMVVVPTWLAQYNKSLAAGREEEGAIYDADKAVRMSQGAGSAKDLAAVQRGTGNWGQALKLMTMFYSYFSAMYQRQRTLGRDIRRAAPSDMPALMARAWWLLVVPPILSAILGGQGPDDDEDWATWAFKQMLFNSLGAIPGVRDAARPIWDGAAGNRGFDYQLSPIQRAGQTFVNIAKDAGKIARGDDTTRATRDVLEGVGYATGLVPGQIASSTQFLVDLGTGDADPETLHDWYEGLTKGHIKE